MNIEIKIDTSQPKLGLADLNKALGLAETGAASVGTAGQTAMTQFSTSADKAKQASQSLADQLKALGQPIPGFDETIAAMDRQRVMLESLRSPIRVYEQDLETLNNLMSGGKITTSEYCDQLDRMNGALAKVHPSTGQTFGPTFDPALAGKGDDGLLSGGRGGLPPGLSTALQQLGPAGSAMTQFASSVGLAGAAAGALTLATVKLGDAYLDLTNSVQRFATAGRSADDIVHDQVGIAGQLHASLSDTSALFLRVAEGSEGLNLSYQQQVGLTRALGESVQLSGHDMNEASSIMEKLAFAMESGSVTSRELRTTLRSDPVLAESWREYFHTTNDGLLQMAKQGKLTAQDLVAATLGSLSQIDAMQAKHVETAGEAWTNFKNHVVADFGGIASSSSGMVASMLGDLTKLVDMLGTVLGAVNKVENAIKSAGKDSLGISLGDLPGVGGMSDLMNLPTKALGYSKDAYSALAGGITAGHFDAGQLVANATGLGPPSEIEQMIGLVDRLGASLTNVTDASDPWSNGRTGLVGYVDGLKDLISAATDADPWLQAVASDTSEINGMLKYGSSRLGEWALGLFNLDKAFKDAGIDLNKFGHELSDEQKLLQSILAPQKQYYEGMVEIDHLLKSGAITAAQYYTEFEKLSKLAPPTATGGAHVDDMGNVVMPSTAPHKSVSFGQSAAGSMPDISSIKDLGAVTQDLAAPTEDAYKAYEKLAESLRGISTPAEKFAAEQARINAPNYLVNDETRVRLLDDLKTKYAQGLSPVEEWAKKQTVINDLFIAGAIDAEHQQRALDALAATYNHGFGQGLTSGLNQLGKEFTDTAKTVSTALTSMVNTTNTDIASALTTGKADWAQLKTDIEQNAIKIALQYIEGQALAGLGIAGAIEGGATLAGATMSAAIVAGATIAAPILAASVAAGAAVGGAAGAAGDALGLFGAASSLLGFASGGSMMFGGGGGPDSIVVPPFRISPGERLDILTPQQQAAQGAQRDDSRGPVQVHVHNHADMESLALAVLRSKGAGAVVVQHVLKNRKALGL